MNSLTEYAIKTTFFQNNLTNNAFTIGIIIDKIKALKTINMKKVKTTILIAIALVLSISKINAQEKGTSEISIGYGLATNNQIIDALGEAFTYPVTLGTVKYTDEKSSNAIHIGYKYALIDKLMVGATVTYEKNSKTVNANDAKIGSETANIYTFAIEGNYRYVSKESFQMYSGLGLGYTNSAQKFDSIDTNASNRNESTGNFNFQVTALGFRFGKKIGFFTELGLGYKGILNAGISYQF